MDFHCHEVVVYVWVFDDGDRLCVGVMVGDFWFLLVLLGVSERGLICGVVDGVFLKVGDNFCFVYHLEHVDDVFAVFANEVILVFVFVVK